MKPLLEHPLLYCWLQQVLTHPRCWDTFIERHLRPLPGQRLLDLGCGVGRLLDFLPPLEYTGLDSNPEYIRFAKKRGKDDAVFICADLCQTPWPVEDTFDLVTITGVFHHLRDDQVLVLLKNARALLKPKGRLVTFDGCYEKPQSWVARALLSMDHGKCVRDRDGYEKLARSVFKEVHSQMERRFLRLPYSHLIMEMQADGS